VANCRCSWLVLESLDCDTTNGSLELDKRMGLVVLVRRMRFTVAAKVVVWADSTLVADAGDVCLVVGTSAAKRTIAENANVTGFVGNWESKGLVDRYEAMSMLGGLVLRVVAL